MSVVWYLMAVIADGDYLNDWLTHVPLAGRALVVVIGFLLSLIGG